MVTKEQLERPDLAAYLLSVLLGGLIGFHQSGGKGSLSIAGHTHSRIENHIDIWFLVTVSAEKATVDDESTLLT